MFHLSDDIHIFRKHFFPLLFLVSGIILIYFNSLDTGFQLDDQQIIDRPSLHVTELSLKSLKNTFYWTPQQRRIYRPFPCLTLGINYYLGNLDPFGYHVVNVSIHILCAISVYVFLLTLLSIPGVRPSFAAKHRYEISVIATFLFAFHPIQTNVATYIIQRMTSMAALFYIVSVAGYICFRLQTLPHREKSVLRKYLGLSLSIIGGILAFLSKQNTAVLPVMILCIDYLFFYNLHDEGVRRRLRRVYALCIFLLLGLLAYEGPKYLFEFIKGYERRDFSLVERLLTQPRIIFFYLRLLMIPDVSLLSLGHDVSISKSLIKPPQTLFAVSGILLLVTAAFFLRKKHNLFAFVIVWYLGNLVIESSIIPLELIFEHRTYLPGILIFLLMSFSIVYVSREVLKRHRAILFTALLLILYGNGTYIRNVLFKNSISLWLDVVDKSPNLARAHSNLGNIYRIKGYYEQAIEELKKAIELDPNMIEPHLSLGQLYLDMPGMEDKGLAFFKKAQKLDIYTPRGRLGLGNAYMKVKDYKKAEHFYYKAFQMVRYYPLAINNLGVVKIHLDKMDEAEKIFRYGLRLDSAFEDFSTNLAWLCARDGRVSDAIGILEKYLLKNKGSGKARRLLRKYYGKSRDRNIAK